MERAPTEEGVWKMIENLRTEGLCNRQPISVAEKIDKNPILSYFRNNSVL